MILSSGAYSGTQERRLLNDLLELYNSLERPVYNDTDAINLTVGLKLQQIIDEFVIYVFIIPPVINIFLG